MILIDNLSANGKQYSLLFRFIELRTFDSGHLDSFLDRIFPDLLGPSVWKGLCGRLHTETRHAKRIGSSDLLFTYEKGLFNGILYHLNETCMDNVGAK